MINLSQLARDAGLGRSCIEHRLKRGDTLTDALAIPAQKRSTAISDASRETGVKYATIYQRLQNGATLEQAASATTHCEACHRDYNEIMLGDHNHDTGKFRGLICRRCNTVLGFVCDDPETLRMLADYVEKNTA